MVPGAGIEPARLLKREILSLLCLPISPSGQAVLWWAPRESNTAPTDYESAALTNMS